MPPRDWTAHPHRAYAAKHDTMVYPGNAAAANAIERSAEDLEELELGLVANELLNTKVVNPDNTL